MEESQRKFIRLKAVQELVSLGKTRIYEMASNGNFPKPCKLGPPLKNPDGIVVKGMLEKSAVFTAENKNQRFLVLDDDNRISYYAVSAIQGLDLSHYVGKKVSMLGQAQYDTVTRIRILRVTNIVEQSAIIKDDKTVDKTDDKTVDKKTEEKVIK